MAPTHVQFLEVFPSHEPYRSSSSSFSSSSSSSTGRLGFEDEDENEEELVHGANARWQPWRLSMNRSPSSHPSPPVGEKVPEGREVGGGGGSWFRFGVGKTGGLPKPGGGRIRPAHTGFCRWEEKA